jgi:DNA repair protein RecN (Recombination protein N)
MLTELYVRDFAIVHRLELTLRPGFTVLTGETGAGKSILIDALALVLGDRADTGSIRHGCTRAEVSARFELAPEHEAAQWLRANELDDSEGVSTSCLLRRIIETDKASKAFINGRPVPIQSLRELGEHLVDIHGQHEHQSLLKRETQRDTLDAYAGARDEVAALARCYTDVAALQTRLDTLTRDAGNRAARLDLVRYQVQELESLALTTEEIPAIEEEHRRLANAAELLEGAQAISHLLYEDEEASVTQALARAISRLEALSQYDTRLAAVTGLLTEASIQVDEAATELRQYHEALDLDPARLRTLEQRLTVMHELARKHQVSPGALPALLERLRDELADLEGADESFAGLQQQIDNKRAEYLGIAAMVSAKRQGAAARLEEEVGAQMQTLGMPGGRFKVALTPIATGDLTSYGLEQVEFQVSANPGQPVKPLTKVASGGELSRISLALQVITSSVGRVPTLIFDEVDVGIGGKVAQIVGRQLHRLGTERQVLCITHLAQVAAQGDQHLQVAKQTEGDTTITEIRPLTKTDRVMEIARMIGGIEISAQTLAHAQEMLDRVPA